jgi:cellulose biosynthesis protein BcsQ
MKGKETLFLAFSTQKCGVGKTTLNVLTASYLHYVRSYNVAVIDCDYSQHSIVEMCGRDVEQVMNDNHYKRMAHVQFTAIGKKAYTVEECSAVDAVAKAEELQREGELDFIFFDLPGTMNAAGGIKTLACMDYILVPISLERCCHDIVRVFCPIRAQARGRIYFTQCVALGWVIAGLLPLA